MVVGEANIDTDVVVIGGGPGGYVAAIRCAELGLATVLVERDERLGGTCLLRGCIPSKALLTAADAAARARSADAMGIRCGDVGVDAGALTEWRNKIVDRLVRGVAFLLDKHGVTVVRGDGLLAGRRRVAVAASHGSERYNARRGVIVATGATSLHTAALRPDGARVLTAEDAVLIDRLPSTVAIVGADYIAVELAVALRKLGSAVTLVGAGQRLLPEIDEALIGTAERGLRTLGIAWKPKAVALEPTDAGLRVILDTTYEEIPAELIIVSSAIREPNVSELGLDLAGVRQHDEGFILVDECQRTSVDGVFAVGDVTPGAAWAHRAIRQGKVAAECLAGRPAAFDSRAVPAVVEGEPALASVGLGEQSARLLGYDPVVSRFPWAASGRAMIEGSQAGQTVVVSSREDGVVLGVHIAGSGAGELIGEAALAIEMGATVEDIAATIHAHPTVSEGIAECADLALDLPTHVLAG